MSWSLETRMDYMIQTLLPSSLGQPVGYSSKEKTIFTLGDYMSRFNPYLSWIFEVEPVDSTHTYSVYLR